MSGDQRDVDAIRKQLDDNPFLLFFMFFFDAYTTLDEARAKGDKESWLDAAVFSSWESRTRPEFDRLVRRMQDGEDVESDGKAFLWMLTYGRTALDVVAVCRPETAPAIREFQAGVAEIIDSRT